MVEIEVTQYNALVNFLKLHRGEAPDGLLKKVTSKKKSVGKGIVKLPDVIYDSAVNVRQNFMKRVYKK